MDFQRLKLRSEVSIDQIITIFYHELGKHYSFHGESHNFWEMLYVDKGELEVWGDDRHYRTGQGTVIFHKPNEFHKFDVRNNQAPNVIVLTFDCDSAAMKRFEHAIVRLHDEERNLLANLIKEAKAAFEFPFRYPLVRRADAPLGAEQMVKLYLETLLVLLLRRGDWRGEPRSLTLPAKEKEYDRLTNDIIGLLQESVDAHVTLEELSSALRVSKTVLKDVFKQNTGQTVIEYFTCIKIEEAKRLIREGTYNFTEIAALLGFNSVHVFSKVFKRLLDMTPSEYARSVKGRIPE